MAGYAHPADLDFRPDTPRLILRKKELPLTEVEKKYGKGETAESVWAKHCPNPQDYGKPRADGIPFGSGKTMAYVNSWENVGFKHHENHTGYLPSGYVYAFALNYWQKRYGEDITDAASLEAKLRKLGKLDDDEEIEPELAMITSEDGSVRWASRLSNVLCGVPSSPCFRAIVRKKPAPKKRYLKVPLEDTVTDVEVFHKDAEGRFSRYVYRRRGGMLTHGATIVEE